MPSRGPCQNCRQHHLKCDDGHPKCGRCQRSRRDCIRPQRRWQFRHITSTGYSQRDVGGAIRDTPQRVRYNEAPEVVACYSNSTCDPRHHGPTTFASTNDQAFGTLRTPDRSPRQQTEIDATLGISHTPSEPESLTATPFPHGHVPSEIRPSVWAPGSLCLGHPLTEKDLPRLIVDPENPLPSHVPQKQPAALDIGLEGACLLRYFVEDLAKWFDLCDPERHFALVVPQRARSCPPLLNAILSVSARHFSTFTRDYQMDITRKYGVSSGLVVGEESALHYHSKSIAHLRSVSGEPEAIMDENLLAAVVVLRFYEELDSPFIDLPNETAVRGLQVFIEAQAASALASPGLRHAVFWVGFRQEFHMAFSQQRPFRLPLSICEDYRPWPGAPDHIWTNHLLIICAQVIQYCFGDQFQPSYSQYKELVRRKSEWLGNCPASFSPVYSESPDRAHGELFPKVWYMYDWHIVAVQSVGLANILLMAYNPSMARIGPNQKQEIQAVDTNIKSTVMGICGIALSNRQSPTSLLTACIATVMCADRFDDQTEQEALMDIVVNMNRDNNYWPSTAMQTRLRETWNWGRW